MCVCVCEECVLRMCVIVSECMCNYVCVGVC